MMVAAIQIDAINSIFDKNPNGLSHLLFPADTGKGFIRFIKSKSCAESVWVLLRRDPLNPSQKFITLGENQMRLQNRSFRRAVRRRRTVGRASMIRILRLPVMESSVGWNPNFSVILVHKSGNQNVKSIDRIGWDGYFYTILLFFYTQRKKRFFFTSRHFFVVF